MGRPLPVYLDGLAAVPRPLRSHRLFQRTGLCLCIWPASPVSMDGLAAVPRPLRSHRLFQRAGLCLCIWTASPVSMDGLAAVPRPLRSHRLFQRAGLCLCIWTASPVSMDGLAAVPRPLRSHRLFQRAGLCLCIWTASRPFPDRCGAAGLSRGPASACVSGRPRGRSRTAARMISLPEGWPARLARLREKPCWRGRRSWLFALLPGKHPFDFRNVGLD